MGNSRSEPSGWRVALYRVIFEADTPAGKFFDVTLIAVILLSVVAVMFDSVAAVREPYGDFLYGLEWFFTILFTVEYTLRLLCVGNPLRYATSFFGVVDLLAVLPTYLSILLPGSQYLLVIRILRILRIFRVLKLVRYIQEARVLGEALLASRRKIFVFLFTVLTLVVIFGSVIYLIEGEEHGFTSIPQSIYWAIVTLTTVGYGDISPKTAPGQLLASLIMILGYSIIAVPTGIVTAELSSAAMRERRKVARVCPQCLAEGHDDDALHCKYCGAELSVHDEGKGTVAGKEDRARHK
jgi:voltage-gated potassium channel